MLLINTKPLHGHNTMANYGDFIMKRFILPYFDKGSQKKMLFDDPGEQAENPKVFEQARHDTRSLTLDNDTNTYKMERVIPM